MEQVFCGELASLGDSGLIRDSGGRLELTVGVHDAIRRFFPENALESLCRRLPVPRRVRRFFLEKISGKGAQALSFRVLNRLDRMLQVIRLPLAGAGNFMLRVTGLGRVSARQGP